MSKVKVHISRNYESDEWESMMSSWEQTLKTLQHEGADVTITEPDDDLTYSPEIIFTLTVSLEIAELLKTMLMVFYGLDGPMDVPSNPCRVYWEEQEL